MSQPMIPGPARTGLVVGAPVGVSLTCRGFLLNVTCELVAVSWFSGISGEKPKIRAFLKVLLPYCYLQSNGKQNKPQNTANFSALVQ